MRQIIHKTRRWIFGVLCVSIGLYPIIYLLIDVNFGLLLTKPLELLSNQIWNIGFYGHISLGGLALLVGWTQFSAQLRTRSIKLHRVIGKIYVLAVMISGVCGIYIAQFATGGLSNVIGFSLLGLFWLSTTFLAYQTVRRGKIVEHQNYMIYSYALCFSAVTLRIWLPLLTSLIGDFNTAYLIVGWLCWVPNLMVAYYMIHRKKIIAVA